LNLEFEIENDKISLKSDGKWIRGYTKDIYKKDILRVIKKTKGITFLKWDFENLEEIDSAGVILILEVLDAFRQNKTSIVFENLKPNHQKLFLFYRKNHIANKLILKPKKESFFEKIGKGSVSKITQSFEYFEFSGELTIHLLKTLLNPLKFRFAAFVRHIHESGLQALPIVTLASFLVGLVVAYQGAFQLKKFGANIFIVDMSAISIFRELAPMIAAIVIAGRSASAFTAEIGTLKITDEIDAMRTMGFHPMRFLVIPRITALMISMPLIVFFADMLGLFG